MIFDKVSNLAAHKDVAEYAAHISNFIETGVYQSMVPGEWKVINDRLKVILLETFNYDARTMETHTKFNDLHTTLAGADRIGIAAVHTLADAQPYNSEKDFALHSGADQQTVDILPGLFLFLTPQDAHHNHFLKEGTRKLVFKMPVQ
jgi:YhcH/YjgK/YiaL family protein